MADEKTAEELAAEKAAAEVAAKAEEDAKKKIKFTAEQTKIINDLFNQGFKDGASKAEAALNAKLDEEKKAREALKAELDELKKKAEKPKEEKPDPQIEAFKAQVAEMQGILSGIKTERDELKKTVTDQTVAQRKSRKKDAFLSALNEAKVSFFDPLEAYSLAEGMGYEWDEQTDRPVVLNKETNRPKLNSSGEPMTVIDFVKDFAEKKKYLVKADNQDGGTGGGSERRVDKPKVEELPDAKEIESMKPEEFEAFVQGIMNKPR